MPGIILVLIPEPTTQLPPLPPNAKCFIQPYVMQTYLSSPNARHVFPLVPFPTRAYAVLPELFVPQCAQCLSFPSL